MTANPLAHSIYVLLFSIFTSKAETWRTGLRKYFNTLISKKKN